MNETIFRLEDITFAYPECEPVLKNFNLNIKNGECLSILGANGCGKSTLLKILAGLIFPTNGTFTAFNKQIDEKYLQKAAAVSYHRKVGFVFQDSEVQLFCSTVY
ncbi:MAG TPA: nickel ABC transporter ATP-binding protein, partial [Ruminococcaceae bacterium]|nr:nickel ABC transporter ATP-binding protein [Oscillospiraceae bacterium]